MKRSLNWVAMPLLMVALCGVGFAADSASTTSPPAAGETKSAPKKIKKTKSAAQKFRGAITVLDAKAGTLSVKSDASEKDFITQDAVKDSIEKMKVGDRVNVTYSEKEGKLFASSVKSIKVKNAATTKTQKDASKSAKPPAKDSTPAATK